MKLWGCILLKLNNKKLLMGTIAVISLFFLIFFKFTGLRLLLGIIFIFILPVYLILDYLKFSSLERIIYSFFLGMGIIPTLVYYMGLVISFRLSIIIALIILFGTWFFIKRRSKVRVSDEQNKWPILYSFSTILQFKYNI